MNGKYKNSSNVNDIVKNTEEALYKKQNKTIVISTITFRAIFKDSKSILRSSEKQYV